MKFKSLIFLMLISIAFNMSADTSENNDISQEIPSHLDPGIAVVKANNTQKFPPSFCAFILETAPQEAKDKIALLKDPYCPSWLIPKKILLYGPSGSGKTTLAQVIAQEIDRPFIYISAGLLGNEYKNSVAQNLRRAIEPYKGAPCVVIIDEIDCILKKATNEKDLDQNTPKQVWEIIDLCAQLPNVLVIGITNDVRGMDEPLQTRFAGDTVEIPLLNSIEMRKKTILFHLQTFVYDLNDSYISSLAKKTKKFSHRELEKLVIAAMASAYLNKKVVPVVGKADFEKAYQQMEKSRSLLNKINWADYEKHLQYGLQIAGLVVNIASLVTNWRMSWLNYLATQKNHKESMAKQDQHQQENRAQGEMQFREGQLQTQLNADRAYEQGERGQRLTIAIAERNERRAIKSELTNLINITLPHNYIYDKNSGYHFPSQFNGFLSAPTDSEKGASARKIITQSLKALESYTKDGIEKMIDLEMQKNNLDFTGNQ